MKTSLQILTAVVALSQWPFPFTTARAEDNLINLTLESSEAGGAPSTQNFDRGTVQTEVANLLVTDKNRVEVVKDAADFPGKALRFIKTAPDPRTPWAILVSDKELATAGKFRFTWDACIDSFSSVAKFPGFEALLNFVLLDRTGTPFFNFYYLVGRDETSGTFGSGNRKILTPWMGATKQKFEVVVDLDAKTATIKIDGDQVGEEISLPPNMDGLRVVEFTDGTGVANYDGNFTATVANFKMTQL
jgi:hypothetical protein